MILPAEFVMPRTGLVWREGLAVLKGLATYVGPLDWYRKLVKRGGSTQDPLYCYTVWMRNLCVMRKFGWDPQGRDVCELGPGNSIGTGIAALFSGVNSYTGLDAFPYSFATNKKRIAELIVRLSEFFSSRRAIPGADQYPQINPELDNYDFPVWLVDGRAFYERIAAIRSALLRDVENEFASGRLNYLAPYHELDLSKYGGSFDAVFSQAVLEHVEDLGGTYRLIFSLLRPQGWSWHVIDFRCHGVSSDWNGHWRYPEWLWKIVAGRREFLLNRLTLSEHLARAREAGFWIESVFPYRDGEHPRLAAKSHLKPSSFVHPFNRMSHEDATTMGALLVMRKP